MTDRAAACSNARRLLTLAALALPGISGVARAADDPTLSVTISHYDEGERELYDQDYASLDLQPITVQSVNVEVTTPVVEGFDLAAHYGQDSWSGATPVVSVPNAAVRLQLMSGASTPTVLYTDAQHRPVVLDLDPFDPSTAVVDERLVHVMASASPETRRQGALTASFGLGSNAQLDVGGGLSIEHDYHSRFVNVGGKVELDRKLTTVSWQGSYTWSSVAASLAANNVADWGAYTDQIEDRDGQPTLVGKRHDFAAQLGVTRVLNRNAVIEAGVTWTRSSGLLENPYKAVMFGFDDPDQEVDPSGLRYVPLKGVLEQRPDQRDQLTADLRFVQFIHPLDASLHLGYRYYHDDWGITAHTVSASLEQPLFDGWTLTPGVRYYSQSKADFYAPFFVFSEAIPAHPGGPLDFSQIPIDSFSSDARLSGFGAVNASLGLSKHFRSGLAFDLAYEYYLHRGSLGLGSDNEGSFADYDSSVFSASLSLDLNALAARHAEADGGFDEATATPLKAALPAGLVLASMPEHAGAWSFDVAYLSSASRGGLKLDGAPVDDDTIINSGCGASTCTLAPTSASRNATLLEIRYALTDWLTLEAVPQFVDNRLRLRTLDPFGLVGPLPAGPDGSGAHQSSGLGDITLAALVRLIEAPGQHLHAALGVGLPYGDSGVTLSGQSDQASYALQRGSGSWELHPSATYTLGSGPFSAGAQVSGIYHVGKNGDGYKLGNKLDATAWLGFSPVTWLTLTGRLEYEHEGRMTGSFGTHIERNVPHDQQQQADYDVNGDGVVDENDTVTVTVYEDEVQPHTIAGPEDLPGNYGGTEWLAGVGLTARVPGGPLRGDTLGIEWLEPMSSSLNGMQLGQGRVLAVRLGFAL